jgi:phage-related protein
MAGAVLKDLVWIASSRKDLRAFPDDVRRVMGFALYLAQSGEKHPDAKPLRGFHGAGVLEVVDDFDGDTFRTVYTIRLGDVVYVLHAFQKKSKRGVATPRHEIDLIRERYDMARRLHALRQGPHERGGK